MQLKRSPASAGFTMVELAVGLAIVAILMALALPSFTSYLQGAKLRNSVRDFETGVTLARTEAIRRNRQVQFILTDTPVSASMAADAASSVTGRNWVVRVVNPIGAPTAFTQVQAKAAAEGSGQAGQVSSVQVSGSVDGITFTPLGSTTVGANATFAFTNPAGGACVADGGPIRCLSVVVSPGGLARICDPMAAAGDPRHCS
jgi:type IV fimbrial biogenesis protein FimT